MAKLGPKLRDGLRSFADLEADRSGPFADLRLQALGYPPKVANSIMGRLERRGWIEYGVSVRSGWLTDEGRAVLRRLEEPMFLAAEERDANAEWNVVDD